MPQVREVIEQFLVSLPALHAPSSMFNTHKRDLQDFIVAMPADFREVTASDMQAYLDGPHRLTHGRPHHRYVTLCTFYQWATREELIEETPMVHFLFIVQSRPFKEFLEEFFSEQTPEEYIGGIDYSSLSPLSPQERGVAEDIMLERLESQEYDSRYVDGLSILGTRRVIPFLLNYLKNPDYSSLRSQAAGALRNFPCQQVAQALDEALSDEDDLVRMQVASTLLAFYEGKVSPSFWGNFNSKDPKVRTEAIMNIRALGKEKSLPPCEDVKMDRSAGRNVV